MYYVSRKDTNDWRLKAQIETVLREHRSYGSRRIAIALSKNRKGIRRVMRKYGIKPYRRRGRRWRRKRTISEIYPNLLLTLVPAYPNHVWAADFTELMWKGKIICLATVIDLYTREIVGVAVATRKGTVLTMQALCAALLHHSRPTFFTQITAKSTSQSRSQGWASWLLKSTD